VLVFVVVVVVVVPVEFVGFVVVVVVLGATSCVFSQEIIKNKNDIDVTAIASFILLFRFMSHFQ
jgi:hypothetical protein